MTVLQLDDVNFGYGSGDDRYEVFDGVNLSVQENEFVAVIGFSGAGKSTLVSLMAGLQPPDRGEVRFAGQINPEAGPERGVVFQNYSLLPWLSVFENIELAVNKVFPEMQKSDIPGYIQQYIDLVSLTGSEWKKPSELSGGMRQRLSLVRTLSMQPKMLLLDEPLSALDALTRAVLQDEITRLWEEDRRTVVMITNDVDEAILMADRIVPLTVGPSAKLGDDFVVDIPRPRDRATINFDPKFRTLRNEVTQYLLALNDEVKQTRPKNVPMPDVSPLDFTTL